MWICPYDTINAKLQTRVVFQFCENCHKVSHNFRPDHRRWTGSLEKRSVGPTRKLLISWSNRKSRLATVSANGLWRVRGITATATGTVRGLSLSAHWPKSYSMVRWFVKLGWGWGGFRNECGENFSPQSGYRTNKFNLKPWTVQCLDEWTRTETCDSTHTMNELAGWCSTDS